MFNLKLLSNKAFDSIQNRFNSKDSITVCLNCLYLKRFSNKNFFSFSTQKKVYKQGHEIMFQLSKGLISKQYTFQLIKGSITV